MKLGIRLVVFLVLLIITVFPAAAKPGLGSSPYAAESLGNGLNVGTLASGEDFWYVFAGADLSNPSAHNVALNMVYKPGGHEVAAYVNFQVFSPEQVDRWLQGYADQYIGVGTYTTTDFDQETAERLWSGSLLEGQSYYVRLFNNSRQSVDYHLTVLGQAQGNATEVRDSVSPASNVIPAVSLETSLEPSGDLAETQWLLVAAAVQSMSPEDAAAWLMMASQIGWLPPNALELNTKLRAETASYATRSGYASLERAAAAETAETSRAETEVAPTLSLLDIYPSVYPSAPLALHDGVNVGKLAPGGEHWYSFIREDEDTEWFEFMPMTLFSTPTDGNSSHHINFQIFTAAQLQLWARGTPDDMVPMGAGQWISRDRDPVTGERIWAGHVIDGDLYYIRIFNHSDHVIDYYLITNDITNTELGDRVWVANPVYRHTLWQPNGYVPTAHR